MVRVTVPHPRDGPAGLGKVFVEMATEEQARAVLVALKGRTFDGRVVDVKYMPAEALGADGNADASIEPPNLVLTTAGLMTIDRVNMSAAQLASSLSGSSPSLLGEYARRPNRKSTHTHTPTPTHAYAAQRQ